MSIFEYCSDIHGDYQEKIKYREISMHLVATYNARYMEISMPSFYAYRCPWRYLGVSMCLFSVSYMEISVYFYALCL